MLVHYGLLDFHVALLVELMGCGVFASPLGLRNHFSRAGAESRSRNVVLVKVTEYSALKKETQTGDAASLLNK